jgi:hypothetical protein
LDLAQQLKCHHVLRPGLSDSRKQDNVTIDTPAAERLNLLPRNTAIIVDNSEVGGVEET